MRRWYSKFGVTTLSLAALAAGFFGGRPLMERVEYARAANEVDTNRQQLSTVEDLSTVFRHVGQVVEPSVVKIEARIEHASAGDANPLRHFFQNPQGGEDQNPQQPDPQQDLEQIGTGSGVIMDAADGYGYILTNNHVAANAASVTVTLADGRLIREANCKVLGTDPKSDLAVIRIKADRLIPAKWGNSDELEKGDWIMAFGAPFGYVGSMTHGIVSALHRDDVGILSTTGGYENFIQVDAPINPGNSGGPLVNIHGEVVGINTAIATVSGGFQGIGFAIPSNQATVIYTELKQSGKVVRGWLGIRLGDLSEQPGLGKSFGYSSDEGVLVDQTYANTPASGVLQSGDIIESFGGTSVANSHQLRDVVANTPPGTKSDVKIFRDRKEMHVSITVGSQPENLMTFGNNNEEDNGQLQVVPQGTNLQQWGLTLQTLDKDKAAKLGLHGVANGALILSVVPESIAARAGLHGGDVISGVADAQVHSAEEAADALNKADVKQGVRLYITTSQGSTYVFLQSADAGN